MERMDYNNIKKFNGKIYNGFCYFDDVKTKISENDIVDITKYAIEDRVENVISNNRSKEEIKGIMNIVNTKIIPELTYEIIIKNIKLYGIYDFVDNTISQLALRAYFENN